MQRSCRCPNGKHRPLVKTSADGKVTGIPAALAESGAYPRAMGRALVQCWRKGSEARALKDRGQKRPAEVRQPCIVKKKPAKSSPVKTSWKQPPAVMARSSLASSSWKQPAAVQKKPSSLAPPRSSPASSSWKQPPVSF